MILVTIKYKSIFSDIVKYSKYVKIINKYQSSIIYQSCLSADCLYPKQNLGLGMWILEIQVKLQTSTNINLNS